MNDWSEFLAFRKFITPVFIQVIFWIGVVVNILAAFAAMFTHQILFGIVWLFIGPFVVRIYCELLILLFRIYDELVALRTGTPPSAQGFPVIQPPMAGPTTTPTPPVV